MAHRMSARGLRGADRYWRLAETVNPPRERGLVQIGVGACLDVRSSDVGERLLYRGLHEREERAVLSRLVDSGGTCLDVGANIGSYTALFAFLTGASGSVVAFEPATDVRHRLQRAMAAMPWVTVLPYALGDSTGRGVLSASPDHAGKSTLRPGPVGATATVTVDVRRLDDLDVIPRSKAIDVMKVDVEGWEGSVLAGAGELFADPRVGALMLEASPEFGPLDYLQPLLDHGRYTSWAIRAVHSRSRLRFTPSLVPVERHQDIPSQCNVLFIRDDRLQRVQDLLAC